MTYTLPKLPADIDAALRRRAQQENRAVEALIMDLLAQGVGLGPKKRDLSGVAGKMTPDDLAALEEVRRFHDRVDPEMWK